MIKNRMLFSFTIFCLLSLLLSACASGGSVDLNLAQTYAAQTLAAMPTEMETAEPTPPEVEPTPSPTEDFTATPLPTLEPLGPVGFPEDVNPLTGLRVSDPSILDRRPVFVKVSNYPMIGRPHAGLSSADLVFEYYIGYGGNRFVGLFYGQDADMIGPVRSARLVDPYLVSLYEGILGFSGANPLVTDRVDNVLGNRGIKGENLCPGICDDGRNTVISVFGDSEALTNIASSRGVVNQRYSLEGMAFDQNPPEGGQGAEVIRIRFSMVNPNEWRYDPESGFYLRWIDDEEGQPIDLIPLVDRVNDDQLAFSNVVVIFAKHNEIQADIHDIFLWDNTDGKRAVVFRDGQAYDLNWKTPSRTQPIQLIDSDGEVFRLKHGHTWVVIMGENSDVTSVDGAWTFDFFLP